MCKSGGVKGLVSDELVGRLYIAIDGHTSALSFARADKTTAVGEALKPYNKALRSCGVRFAAHVGLALLHLYLVCTTEYFVAAVYIQSAVSCFSQTVAGCNVMIRLAFSCTECVCIDKCLSVKQSS